MNVNDKLAELAVNCSRGAPMGRQQISDNPNAVVYLEPVEFIDGDYDRGGAYWGGAGSPLFCAMSEAGDFLEFVRAPNWETARDKIRLEYPNLQFADNRLERFLGAYIVAALWSSLDDNGDPLDANYGREEISPDTLKEFRDDCAEFLRRAGELIGGRIEQAAYDFWLTRNGHGCGFWEETDWPENGEQLAKIAGEFAEINLYIGDDGKVY